MGIEWKEGAVCFANKLQHFALADFDTVKKFAHTYDDFQLNTIKLGDFIEASELDTKRKYYDVIEVFELFGFAPYEIEAAEALRYANQVFFASDDLLFIGALEICKEIKRKLTYQQIMAIGELKRLEIERDKSHVELSVDGGEMSLNSNFSANPNSSNCKTSKDYLSECIEVQNQRGEQYDSKGTGERSFAAAASAFNAMTGQNLKGSDVCLLLTCVKAVRQYSDTTRVHEDSLLDLVSYASLWAEELNKELK